MGWGAGMGVGWGSSQSGMFFIKNCEGQALTVYSTYRDFMPGAVIYTDPQMTHLFVSGGTWNYPELIKRIGGYGMGGDGIVKPGIATCPV